MNNMNWKIKNMMAKPHEGLENVVTSVLFEVSKTSGEFTVDYSSSCILTLGDSFTPFADLTEDQVISWVKADLGEDMIKSIENSLDGQLESLTNPPVSPEIVELPWS